MLNKTNMSAAASNFQQHSIGKRIAMDWKQLAEISVNNNFSRIKYPKLILLVLSFVFAYYLFTQVNSVPFLSHLLALGYVGTFFIGTLFSYGFTSAPATALLLIISKEQNLFITVIVAMFGAVLSDMLIFKFIRTSFQNELEKLSQERIVVYFTDKIPQTAKRYIIPIVAGFIIASPLPDEIGVFIYATSATTSFRVFTILSLIFNGIGVFIILTIGRII